MKFRNLVCIAIGLLIALARFTAVTYAWEADVHYGLTYWLAIKEGFSPQHAELIAKNDLSMDLGTYNPATWATLHALSQDDPGAARAIQKNHFPSYGMVPGDPAKRAVDPGGKAARELLEKFLKPDPTKPVDASLRDVGETLHALQDSWSHQGIPDVPPFPFTDPVHPELGYGHPTMRHGWYVHDADLPQIFPTDLMSTAMATCDALLRFQHSGIVKNAPTPCSQLAPQISAFAKAQTKQEKKAWFSSDPQIPFASYPNQTFLNDITIPGAGSVVIKRTAAAALAARQELDRRSVQVPQQLRDLIELVLKMWIVQKNIPGLFDFVNLSEIGKQLHPPGLPSGALQEWLRKFFALYLIDDHGLANRNGHGDPKAPGYALLPQTTDSAQYRFLSYERLEDAIDSPSRAAPYSIQPVTQPPPGIDSAYAVVFSFRNQPHDSIGLVFGRVGNNWRILRIAWGIS